MEWKFKKDIEPQNPDCDFWYDLADGGYIQPVDLLEDIKQAVFLKQAIDTVKSFEEAYFEMIEEQEDEE